MRVVNLNLANEEAKSREEAEALLKQRRSNFDRILEIKSQLAYSERLSAISHFTTEVAEKLNDCLTPIVCYSQLISQSEDGSRFKDQLRKINEAANQARGIMEGLIEFTGRQPRHWEKLNINRIVRETVSIARDLIDLEEFEIVCEETATLPAISGDPHQLVQMLLHLIRNAHQATSADQRPIHVRTSAAARPLEGETDGKLVDWVELVVEDRGCGIPTRMLPKLLLPFYSSHKEDSAGLGLSIVFGIVEAHGGDFEIETEVGKGTTVRVSLPTQYRPDRHRKLL